MSSITPRLAAVKTVLAPNWRLLIFSISLLLSSFLSGSKYLTCQVFYRDDARIQINSQSLSAEVVASDPEREKGLSGRSCIGLNQAMLFKFDKPGIYPFWMKDMRFAIDMVWLDSSKKVVFIKSYVTPATYPQTFVSIDPAQYVLELKAGRAGQLGLEPADRVNF